MGGNVLIQLAGATIVAAVAVEAAAAAVGAVRRLRTAERGNRLALEFLRLKLERTRVRRAETQDVEHGWNGFRKFEVIERVEEARDIASFYLAPHDRKPIAPSKPGQFLTFRLKLPGHERPVIRCYSLSDRFEPGRYRITVKRVVAGRGGGANGLVSSYFHEHVRVGDILDVGAPRGGFVLDLAHETPIVLAGAGIGITPLLSMLNEIASSGAGREVRFFYGARNKAEHPMREHVRRLAREHRNVRVHVAYSQPGPDDAPGVDYDSPGWVTIDLLKAELPSNNYEFYLCGPPPFMEALMRGLETWGVPPEHVRFEAFGPATVMKVAPAPARGARRATVTFGRAGRSVAWDPAAASLLDFAEANGVRLDSGCRAGDCNACLTAIRSGEVAYRKQPGSPPESGSCLTCICVPAGDLTLDA